MSPNRPLMRRVLGVGDIRFEKMIGDRLAKTLIKPTVVPEPRQNDFGENKQRNHLHEHEHDRLERDVRCVAPANSRDPESNYQAAVEKRVIERTALEGNGYDANQGRTIRYLRLPPPA